MANKKKNNKNKNTEAKKVETKVTEEVKVAEEAVEEKVEETVEETVKDAEAEVKTEGKKDKKSKEKKELSMAQRKARHGVLTSVSVVVVIAIVIAVNIFLSSKEWSVDLTKDKLYTLSDESDKILSNLTSDQQVTLYFLASQSTVNTVYSNILDQYDKYKNVKVEYKDLDKFPTFASQYLDDTEEAAENDLIVVCGDRSKYISSDDYLSYNYDTSGNTNTVINIEPKITAAIDYCITGETDIIYTLTGQGEQDLGDNFSSDLESDNYDVESLDVVSMGGIPTDCSLLIINAPSTDIPDTVIDMIDQYMENDGRLFVVVDPNDTYENLNALLKKYNVEVQDGIVVETGTGYYMSSYPTYVLPTLSSHDITTPISEAGLTVLAPVCKGLVGTTDDENYTVTDLLVTSSSSFSKTDLTSNSIEQTDDDIAGPFALAQVVDTASGDPVLFVSGCSSMGVDEIDDYVSNANSNFYSNAVNYLIGADSKISIKPTSVTTEYCVFTAFASKMALAIGVIGIPLFLIILGIVVIVVRKRN